MLVIGTDYGLARVIDVRSGQVAGRHVIPPLSAVWSRSLITASRRRGVQQTGLRLESDPSTISVAFVPSNPNKRTLATAGSADDFASVLLPEATWRGRISTQELAISLNNPTSCVGQARFG